jgi:hypothetical protein
MVSRWETGSDLPTARYLDALCYLYRTRPDRLGFGNDYSDRAPLPATGSDDEDEMRRRRFLQAAASSAVIAAAPPEVGELLADSRRRDGRSARAAVELFERRVEQSGYHLYTTAPVDFVPARMLDIAGIQKLLLHGQPMDLQRRLYRALAKNAGFIGIRLTDVASVQETFNWFGVGRHAARRAEDAGVEAWIAGHLCDAHSCYGHSLRRGLETARVAQLANGTAPNSAALFGYLSEAGVQARLGRRRETLDAVRAAERIFDALPESMIAADGIRIPEYFLRWHQSNALSIVGEARLAGPLRRRALEQPLSRGDLVGRSLLYLDEADLLFRSGDLEQACGLVRAAWDEVPTGFHVGQIPSRTSTILRALPTSRSATPEVTSLREYVHTLSTAAASGGRRPRGEDTGS